MGEAPARAGRTGVAVLQRVLVGALLTFLTIGAGVVPARSTTAHAASLAPHATRIDPALTRRMTANPSRMLPVIVEMRPAQSMLLAHANQRLAEAALALLGRFGRPVAGLALINGASGFANAADITSLSLDPRVAFVHADATVRAASAPPAGGLVSAYPAAVRADQAWRQGLRGDGVAVAVLDSGIRPDADLSHPNRVLARVNFADAQSGSGDPAGHGTHVAGIVAGDGYRSLGEYVGIAPGAGLLDVRVLDESGNGRISSVVRGIEWVLAHRAHFNIRVINLSLGMPARLPYVQDPLCAAVEIAWLNGLTVVAAVGNTGPAEGTVDSPGIDPYVVTVGATDDVGTAVASDDVLNAFSAWGTPPGSTSKPDLVAPGRRITSLPAPGSFLFGLYPDRITRASNAEPYFRLTGTSMSTAVVSGSAALLHQQRPHLSNTAIKHILTRSAQPYGSAPPHDPRADGEGLLDVRGALSADIYPPSRQGHRPADVAARALYPVLYGQPLIWKNPQFRGIGWTALTWASLVWDTDAWDNLAWDQVEWEHLAWDHLAWDHLAWDHLAWDHLAWDHLAWDAATLD